MFYLAAEIYRFLADLGCEYDGDLFDAGQGWFTPNGLCFMLPAPFEEKGVHWFYAEVIDDNFANRWIGMVPNTVIRYEKLP